jgi:hypothetical protein
MGTGSFPGVKRPGRGADHPPLLVPRSRKSRAISPIPLPPSRPLVACYRVTFTFTYILVIFKYARIAFTDPTFTNLRLIYVENLMIAYNFTYRRFSTVVSCFGAFVVLSSD